MNNKEKIQVIMFEYQQLRQALLQNFQTQTSSLTIGVGFLSALMVFTLGQIPVPGSNIQNPTVAMMLFCIIIPGATAFLAIVWFSQTHAQVETGVYLALLENKMNNLAVDGEQDLFPLNDYNCIVHWEHWNKQQFKGKSFFNRTNQYYFYVCYGLFLALPIGSLSLWWVCTVPIKVFSTVIGISVFCLIYSALLFFSIKYTKRILAYDKEISAS